MSRRVYSKEVMVRARSFVEARKKPVDLEVAMLILAEGDEVMRRWDARLKPDGSLAVLPEMVRARLDGGSGEGPGGTDRLVGRKNLAGPGYTSKRSPSGFGELQPFMGETPDLVPIDESWLKSSPMLDHILAGPLEGGGGVESRSHIDRILNEPLEPEQEDRVRPPPLRRKDLTRSPPPGFGPVPLDAGQASGNAFVRFAKGPTSNKGFDRRKLWASGERQPTLSDPPSIVLPRRTPDALGSTKDEEPVGKQEPAIVKRPEAAGGDSHFENSTRVVSGEEKENILVEEEETTAPEFVQESHEKPLQSHDSAEWVSGRESTHDIDEELAPNVLSFFNAVKAQAVIGAGSRVEVQQDSTNKTRMIQDSSSFSSPLMAGSAPTYASQEVHRSRFDSSYPDPAERPGELPGVVERSYVLSPFGVVPHHQPSPISPRQQQDPLPPASTTHVSHASAHSGSYTVDEFFSFFQNASAGSSGTPPTAPPPLPTPALDVILGQPSPNTGPRYFPNPAPAPMEMQRFGKSPIASSFLPPPPSGPGLSILDSLMQFAPSPPNQSYAEPALQHGPNGIHTMYPPSGSLDQWLPSNPYPSPPGR